MSQEEQVIVVRLLVALFVGAMIGFERSFHGRPAGFRTHSLVCLASALLMVATVYQSEWMTAVPLEAIRTDPTRMAQGIMTGIGFLGAGVIFQEGLTVRGLTTAASIWITAAIGILLGIGFYFPAAIGVIGTLAVLAVFRYIERMLPSEYYAQLTIKFDRAAALSEEQMQDLLKTHGFTIANLSSRLLEGGHLFEYRMAIRSHKSEERHMLSQKLRSRPEILEFRITPTND